MATCLTREVWVAEPSEESMAEGWEEESMAEGWKEGTMAMLDLSEEMTAWAG